ncbi:MAG: hypothetical protein KC609_23685 [Myxococcales bacterium]|nr:hypothetical protein [Myxococcales bacterium]
MTETSERTLPLPTGRVARWLQFAKERFDPLSHLLMIGLFFWVHQILAQRLARGDAWRSGLLLVGTLAFFFKLRLYDEIKDFETDSALNPSRPLVRGLLAHRDLHRGIVGCIAIELVTFGLSGSAALLSIVWAIGYSLLMYREFFIGRWIRPHLTTYAVSHTVVSVWLSLALFVALTARPVWELPRGLLLFSLGNWCLFNIFEFGRKTFTSAEEREGVESYSKIFGRTGAVLLLLVMGAASSYLLSGLDEATSGRLFWAIGGVLGAIAITGSLYAIRDCAGGIYRAASSLYIVLVYATLLIFHYAAW